jgi:hypothetical protein
MDISNWNQEEVPCTKIFKLPTWVPKRKDLELQKFEWIKDSKTQALTPWYNNRHMELNLPLQLV